MTKVNNINMTTRAIFVFVKLKAPALVVFSILKISIPNTSTLYSLSSSKFVKTPVTVIYFLSCFP